MPRGRAPTRLPVVLVQPLGRHLERTRARHARAVVAGAGWLALPDALDHKYPQAGRSWAWQWMFPATRTYRDGVSGQVRRHHLHESAMQRAMSLAVRASGAG